MEEGGGTRRRKKRTTLGSNEKQKFGWRIGYKYVQIRNCGTVRASQASLYYVGSSAW